MAALIENRTGVSANIVEGRRGEFTVWVGDECVAKKDHSGFPADGEIVAAVSRALQPLT